ncbi:MAG: PHP domain-containing protein [Methanomethylovorans sp.]|uniref:CehA/McbA family metallohydrolase n=1 Tax=Methanomethylovorans sp. TaxID=2758717 RepID=UPI000AC32CDE|nr:PHP domain-containing protein [Methanomethylovorans sp.]
MKFDLHVHTRFSKDSDAEIDAIIFHAKMNGLDGFAVCDHDVIEGGPFSIQRAAELGSDLMIIPGVEITTSEGHLLVLGIKEIIEPGLSPVETIRRARAQGAVVILPHPFKVTSHGIGYVEGLDVDAIEVLNARCLTDGPNNKAREAAISMGIAQVGGSDCHVPEMVGTSYTEIDVQERSLEAVLDAIRQGRVRPGGRKSPKAFVIRQVINNVKKKMTRSLKMG